MISFDSISSTLPQQTQIPNNLGSVLLIDNNTKDFLLLHLIKNHQSNENEILTPFQKRYFVRFLEDDYDFFITSLNTQKKSPLYHITKKSNSVVIYETPHNYQVTFFYFP